MCKTETVAECVVIVKYDEDYGRSIKIEEPEISEIRRVVEFDREGLPVQISFFRDEKEIAHAASVAAYNLRVTAGTMQLAIQRIAEDKYLFIRFDEADYLTIMGIADHVKEQVDEVKELIDGLSQMKMADDDKKREGHTEAE